MIRLDLIPLSAWGVHIDRSGSCTIRVQARQEAFEVCLLANGLRALYLPLAFMDVPVLKHVPLSTGLQKEQNGPPNISPALQTWIRS